MLIRNLVILFLLIATAVYPVIRNVPAQYSTIQSAINASQNGDTVLVAEGVYYENINFNGKNITVASTFIISGNRDAILNTVINGSNPDHPDTASCVLIVSGEDSTAVLEGFTLTGGRGTNWIDEHNGSFFLEGGGILITLSSPVIRNNYIVNNEAIRKPLNAISAGGGGIRVGDGSPKIINNVIAKNRGMYGGGIVLNYCSGTVIKNNIINDNRVDQYVPNTPTFGGGGLWILEDKPGDPRPNIVENNTIAGNTSFGSGGGGLGGGMWTGAASIVFMNNIVWGNLQSNGKQLSGNAAFTYNNVEDGITGTGNISVNPAFADTSFFLAPGSPNIDAGNPSAVYNDPNTSGNAIFPSLGASRNDIGAYGGPARNLFPSFSNPGILAHTIIQFGNILPGNSETASLIIFNNGSENLILNNFITSAPGITVLSQFPTTIEPFMEDSILITWSPQQNFFLDDSLQIFHNDVLAQNPFIVHLLGNSNPTPSFVVNIATILMDTIDVNTPLVDTSFYVYNIGTGPDSVYTSIDYNTVSPEGSLVVEPSAFQIAAGDSQLITFTIYPSQIQRNTNDLYMPRIVFDSRFNPGTTHFIKPVRFRLKGILTDVEDPISEFSFKLDQNYPNPFNPSTIIKYEIPSAGKVVLKIYDVLGKEITTLVDEEKSAGVHRVEFNAANLASGIYFCRMSSGSFEASRKLILMK